MTYLFIFAHPDDETVACAATIKQLVEDKQRVIVVSVTDGSAGEVCQEARAVYGEQSVTEIRKIEFENVMTHLGVTEFEMMRYKDGTIDNCTVWSILQQDMLDTLRKYEADVVITFDSTGWYYHLDHVAISIAVTRAFHEYNQSSSTLLYAHFRPTDITDKWKYAYYEVPTDFIVPVNDKDDKLRTCKMHLSQDLKPVIEYIESQERHYEKYQAPFGLGRNMLPALFQRLHTE